jgi:hypothetical protein
MSATIWKFAFDVDDDVTLMMPAGARILDVQLQQGRPCAWAIVDPRRDKEPRRFIVRGTGHPLGFDPDKLSHVGTFQPSTTWSLVFHMFEVHQ